MVSRGMVRDRFDGIRLRSLAEPSQTDGPRVPNSGSLSNASGPAVLESVSPEWGTPPRVLLLCLEIVVMMVILIRYGRRISITTASLCLVAVFAHFCLWGWVMSEFNQSYASPMLIRYLILPLCTILLWGVYARMSISREVS